MSRVLVDKSGLKKETQKQKAAKKKAALDVKSRIKKIHITAEPTVQEFLQPIPLNLRRTPAVQIKQLGVDGRTDQLTLEQKILKNAQDLQRQLKDMPDADKSEIRKFIKNLPSLADIRLSQSIAKGDLIGIANAVKSKEAELSRTESKVKTKKTKKINISIAERDRELKKNAEELKIIEHLKATVVILFLFYINFKKDTQ